MVHSTAYGTKYTCANCATRFYDLRKTPVACPSCGTAPPLKVPVVRRARKMPGSRIPTPPVIPQS